MFDQLARTSCGGLPEEPAKLPGEPFRKELVSSEYLLVPSDQQERPPQDQSERTWRCSGLSRPVFRRPFAWRPAFCPLAATRGPHTVSPSTDYTNESRLLSGASCSSKGLSLVWHDDQAQSIYSPRNCDLRGVQSTNGQTLHVQRYLWMLAPPG